MSLVHWRWISNGLGSSEHLSKVCEKRDAKIRPILQERGHGFHVEYIYTLQVLCPKPAGKGQRHGLTVNSVTTNAYTGRCAKNTVIKHMGIKLCSDFWGR